MKNIIKNLIKLTLILNLVLVGTNAVFAYSINLTSNISPAITNNTIHFNVSQKTVKNISSLPTIDSASAINITGTTATLVGTISTNGATVNAYYQNQNGTTLSGSTMQNLIGNSIPLNPYPLTGLTPNTAYTYTLVITDGPHIKTQQITFTTLSIQVIQTCNGCGGGYLPPYVTTVSSSSITSGTATLNGTVNPNYQATTAWFEYSTSSNFANYSETAHINEGSGSSVLALNQNIYGLSAHTTYYFRLVAQNSHVTKKDTSYKSFTTLNTPVIVPPAPPVIHNNTNQISEDNTNETVDSTTIDQNRSIYPDNNLNTTDNNLAANSIFGINFFPSTLFGWALLVVMILCLAIISRKIYINHLARNNVSAKNIDNLPM